MWQPDTVTKCQRSTPKVGYQSAQVEGKTHHSHSVGRTRKPNAETKTVTNGQGIAQKEGYQSAKAEGKTLHSSCDRLETCSTIQGSQIPEAYREGCLPICTRRREGPTFGTLKPREKVSQRAGIAGQDAEQSKSRDSWSRCGTQDKCVADRKHLVPKGRETGSCQQVNRPTHGREEGIGMPTSWTATKSRLP